jgi:uncharacterized protein YggU (UPF0235/DUF167 family)
VKINIFVKLNSKAESVEPQADGSYIVRVNARPVEGEANERVVTLLAKFFKIPKREVNIIAGLKSKRKVVDIGGQLNDK